MTLLVFSALMSCANFTHPGYVLPPIYLEKGLKKHFSKNLAKTNLFKEEELAPQTRDCATFTCGGVPKSTWHDPEQLYPSLKLPWLWARGCITRSAFSCLSTKWFCGDSPCIFQDLPVGELSINITRAMLILYWLAFSTAVLWCWVKWFL